MLQNIRDNSQGLIAKFIIGLIIVPFALFGIDSLVGGSGPAKTATVNGEEITLFELDQALNVERRRLMNMMGERFDPSLFDEGVLRGSALERLIEQRLMIQAATDAQIVISDAQLDSNIIGMQQFYEGGQFSQQKYQNVLRSNGYTLSYFKQLVSTDLLVNQLNTGIAGSNFITDKELSNVAEIVGQERTFRYITLPKDKVSSSVVVSEQEVESYYQDNLNSFQNEAMVKVDYIEVQQQDFFQAVTEEEILQAYENEKESYKVDEERRASHILLEINDKRDQETTLELAQSLKGKLDSGSSFEQLAKEFSDDLGSANSGGDLGFTKGETFPAEFEEALFSMALNQLSNPIKIESGYHIIRTTEIKQMGQPLFSNRKPILKKQLQQSGAESKFVATVEDLRDQVFNSEGLTGPAKDLSLTIKQSDFISRSTAQGALAKPQVIAAAFSSDVLNEGNNSDVIELANDHFIVINVLEHKPAAAKPLDEVRSQITAIISQQKSVEQSLLLANQLIKQLQGGEAMADLSVQYDYDWQLVDSVSRNSAKTNREILAAVFAISSAPSEEVTRKAISLNNGDVIVVQIDKVVNGSVALLSVAEKNALKNELQNNAVNQSMNGLLGSLRASADINIL